MNERAAHQTQMNTSDILDVKYKTYRDEQEVGGLAVTAGAKAYSLQDKTDMERVAPPEPTTTD